MKALHKYLRTFKMGIQSCMEYRADFLMSIFSSCFILLIQIFLWTAIFRNSTSPVIYGYTYAQMIAYSLVAAFTAKIVSTGFEWEIQEDIKNGGLNKFIVQPIGYFMYRISSFLGMKALQILALIILSFGALFACSYYLDLSLEISRILIFIPFVFLATLLNFLIYYCLSALAFVMTEVWGVFSAANQGILMLSGGIFPLDVFGEGINRILNLLPFKYLISYPANIINGRLTMAEILNGAMIQSIWILILFIIANRVWVWGLKKYVAAGG